MTVKEFFQLVSDPYLYNARYLRTTVKTHEESPSAAGQAQDEQDAVGSRGGGARRSE